MADPTTLAHRGAAHLARVRDLLGPLRDRGNDAWDVPILERLPGHPEAAAEWARAVDTWWTLAQTQTRDLLVSEARRAWRSQVADRYDLDDLIQAGTIGAYRAAQRWSPSAAASWRWYAGAGIRMHVRLALRTGQTEVVSIPDAKRAIQWQLHRAQEELARRGERETVAGLAALVGLDVEVARELLHAGSAVYLDAPLGVDSERTAHDALGDADDGGEDALIARLDSERAARVVREALDALPPRHRQALELRLDGRTLLQAGEALGVGRERARQLEATAMTKLWRHLDEREHAAMSVADVAQTLADRVRRAVTTTPRSHLQVAEMAGIPPERARKELWRLTKRGEVVRVGAQAWVAA